MICRTLTAFIKDHRPFIANCRKRKMAGVAIYLAQGPMADWLRSYAFRPHKALAAA